MNTSLNQRGAMLQRSSRRGTVLLLGFMVGSAGLLLFLGAITTLLREQVSLSHLVQSARAIQLAHSGLEYALWELNHGGNDFQPRPPWTGGPNIWTWTNNGGTITVNVDLNVNTITSTGKSLNGAMTQTISVAFTGGAAPPAGDKLFDNVLYTAELSGLFLHGTAGGSILLDGYDSNQGAYDPASPLPANEVVLMSDAGGPYRKTDWATRTTEGQLEGAADAIILAGNVTVKAKVVVSSPASDESPLTSCCIKGKSFAIEETPGYAIYDATVGGSVVVTGDKLQDTRTIAYYPGTEGNPKDGPEYDPFDPAQVLETISPAYYVTGDTMVICPGKQVLTSEVTVKNATLLIGCSLDPGTAELPNPHFCGSSLLKDFYGFTKSCSGADPSQPVTISTAQGGATGAAALSVGGASGKIFVYSPTTIYYDYPGALGRGLDIGAGGIENKVTKASGAIDTAALKIYGGASGIGDQSYLYTSTPFHGAIFSPYSNVNFDGPSGEKANLDFHGALNVYKIRAWKGSSVRFHWDRPLGVRGSPLPLPGGNFRPTPGSWMICNEPTCS